MEKTEILALAAKAKEIDQAEWKAYHASKDKKIKKWSDEHRKIYDLVKEQRIFKCSCCGKMVSYWSLERWTCDFDNDDYICSLCYEDELGDDL